LVRDAKSTIGVPPQADILHQLGEIGSSDVSQAFLRKSRSLLVSDYLPKIERCLEGLSDDDVWWRANEASRMQQTTRMRSAPRVSFSCLSTTSAEPQRARTGK